MSDTPTIAGDKALPPHVQFVERFKALYEKMTGLPFDFKKQQFILTQRLIKRHGLDVVVMKAKALGKLCRDRGVWFTKNGWADFSIETLSNKWNSILPDVGRTKEDENHDALAKLREQRKRIDRLVDGRRNGSGRRGT